MHGHRCSFHPPTTLSSLSTDMDKEPPKNKCPATKSRPDRPYGHKHRLPQGLQARKENHPVWGARWSREAARVPDITPGVVDELSTQPVSQTLHSPSESRLPSVAQPSPVPSFDLNTPCYGGDAGQSATTMVDQTRTEFDSMAAAIAPPNTFYQFARESSSHPSMTSSPISTYSYGTPPRPLSESFSANDPRGAYVYDTDPEFSSSFPATSNVAGYPTFDYGSLSLEHTPTAPGSQFCDASRVPRSMQPPQSLPYLYPSAGPNVRNTSFEATDVSRASPHTPFFASFDPEYPASSAAHVSSPETAMLCSSQHGLDLFGMARSTLSSLAARRESRSYARRLRYPYPISTHSPHTEGSNTSLYGAAAPGGPQPIAMAPSGAAFPAYTASRIDLFAPSPHPQVYPSIIESHSQLASSPLTLEPSLTGSSTSACGDLRASTSAPLQTHLRTHASFYDDGFHGDCSLLVNEEDSFLLPNDYIEETGTAFSGDQFPPWYL
ncbi:hypothetical protein C8Q77DRAFT_922387 [Trametes polyzona]|nr:hypothetical protein C8Q77DRAFT_922387 [Trametes polyzona]